MDIVMRLAKIVCEAWRKPSPPELRRSGLHHFRKKADEAPKTEKPDKRDSQ